MAEGTLWHNLLIYVPLSIIGLWRWSFWLVRRLGAAAYRPKVGVWREGEPRPTVTVVTPVYNEDEELFDRAVRSWQRNGVDEIVAVMDRSNVRHMMRCEREYVADTSTWTKFRMVVTPKPGKRAALCDGIEAASGDLIALVDSDTTWDDDVLARTVPHFVANPRVGGATVAQRISNPDRTSNVLFDILLWSRYREEVPFLLGVGPAFNTLSGRTAFYRREALLSGNNMHDLRHEFFLGSRAISGDDKRLSHLIIRDGWETAYVKGTNVQTPGLGSMRLFLKQRLRWTRNSWRADLRAVFQGWVFRYPALAMFMIDRFIQPFFMLIGPVVFTLAILSEEWVFAAILGSWWLVSRTVRIFGYFWAHPAKIIYLPAYTIYGYVNAVLKLYALGTLIENSWATRWSQGREVRKGYFRKSTTLIQGYFAIALFCILLTQLALSFRQQLGADIKEQPVYDKAVLRTAVDAHNGVQADPVVPTDKVDPDAVAVYTVQPGDTMLALSERFDTPIPALKKLNGILDGDLILVGQKIVYFRPVEAQQ